MADTTDQWTIDGLAAQLEVVQEAYQDLQQLMVEDRGWARLDGEAEARRFTREELSKAADRCRVMAALNPLVKRGLTVRAGYVWGQGIGINAKDDTVNTVVQEFLDDDENRSVLTGHQAHLDLENRLGTDGNVFITLWTDPLVGRVRPRIVEFGEVTEILTDPEDGARPHYYVRTHQVTPINPQTGARGNPRSVTTYYPDLRYRPRVRPRFLGDGNTRGEVRWDAPMLHVYDNQLTGTRWGIGDAYAALPWAKAYSGFLDDWARLTKALSKIAWTLSSGSKSKAQTARAGLNAATTGAGGVANMGPDMRLEAVPKTGATIDAESGRPIATMIAAALGLPVTTLLADPGQSGARAVAETLDTPTELEMSGRRELWTEAMRAILNYVVDQAALAPRNSVLRGREVRDGDRVTADLGEVDRTLVFDWPDLTGEDLSTVIEAAVKALDTEKFGPAGEAMLVEVILRALKVRDVDEILDKITDDDGQLLDRATTAGDAAVAAFRAGEDPAAVL